MADSSIVLGSGAVATNKDPTTLVNTLKVELASAPGGGSPATVTDGLVTASVATKAVAGTSTTRKGAFLYAVPGSGILYGRFGATAATTAPGGYHFRLFPDDTFQIPTAFLGQAIQGIWDASTGGVEVVEVG